MGPVVNINLNNFKHNLSEVRRLASGKKILAVVKADAYGHGAEKVAICAAANGVDFFGVARVDEGIQLRQCGITKPILCLGASMPCTEEKAVEFNISQNIFDVEATKRLNEVAKKQNKQLGVHIKIETGMHRLGVCGGDALDALLCELKNCPNLFLEGVFTHFADADGQTGDYTQKQISEFELALESIKNSGFENYTVHCANSAAILGYPQAYFDMVRAGIMLYGYYPSQNVKKTAELLPVLSWKSNVVAVNEIKKGEKIGYSGTFTAPRDMRIAVVAVGYGDGYPRILSNKQDVLICGRRAPLVGNICMDMCMADVTDICGVEKGSEVVLIGTSGNTSIFADEVAQNAETISYEILLGINKRVGKTYENS